MKFLEKVKNMFTEEVEEEVTPIQTDIRKIEIPSPAKPIVKEEPKEEVIKQEEPPKKEEKFKFPVYFDEKDFDKIPNPVPEKEPTPKPVPKPKAPPKHQKKEAYGGKNPALTASTIKEDKKTFKPTPIISPVYGILDKNYKKDDITPKKRVNEVYNKRELTVDDIRNKAFGTLEDDLETTLFGKKKAVEEPTNDTLELFDELDSKVEELIQEKTPSRVEKNKELELMNEVDDLEQIVVNDRPEIVTKEESREETNMIAEEMDKICSEPEEEELTESDLFNLIDSMYEKKDGEE